MTKVALAPTPLLWKNGRDGRLPLLLLRQARREVRKLISGPRVFICDECVTLCNDILAKEEAPERPKYPPPNAIVEELDRYVRRPDATPRRRSSVAVYNHYKRIGRSAARPARSRCRRATSCCSARRAPARRCSPRRSPRSSTCRSRSPTRRRSPRPATSARTSRAWSRRCSATPAATSRRPRAASSASTRSTRSRARAAGRR